MQRSSSSALLAEQLRGSLDRAEQIDRKSAIPIQLVSSAVARSTLKGTGDKKKEVEEDQPSLPLGPTEAALRKAEEAQKLHLSHPVGSSLRLSKPLAGVTKLVEGRSDFFAELAHSVGYEVQRLLRYTLLGYTNPLSAELEKKAEQHVMQGLTEVLDHMALYVDKALVEVQKPKLRDKLLSLAGHEEDDEPEEVRGLKEQLDHALHDGHRVNEQLISQQQKAMKANQRLLNMRSQYYIELENQRDRFRTLLLRHLSVIPQNDLKDVTDALANVRLFNPDEFHDEDTQRAVARKAAAMEADYKVEREALVQESSLHQREEGLAKTRLGVEQKKARYLMKKLEEIRDAASSGANVTEACEMVLEKAKLYDDDAGVDRRATRGSILHFGNVGTLPGQFPEAEQLQASPQAPSTPASPDNNAHKVRELLGQLGIANQRTSEAVAGITAVYDLMQKQAEWIKKLPQDNQENKQLQVMFQNDLKKITDVKKNVDEHLENLSQEGRSALAQRERADSFENQVAMWQRKYEGLDSERERLSQENKRLKQDSEKLRADLLQKTAEVQAAEAKIQGLQKVEKNFRSVGRTVTGLSAAGKLGKPTAKTDGEDGAEEEGNNDGGNQDDPQALAGVLKERYAAMLENAKDDEQISISGQELQVMRTNMLELTEQVNAHSTELEARTHAFDELEQEANTVRSRLFEEKTRREEAERKCKEAELALQDRKKTLAVLQKTASEARRKVAQLQVKNTFMVTKAAAALAEKDSLGEGHEEGSQETKPADDGDEKEAVQKTESHDEFENKEEEVPDYHYDTIGSEDNLFDAASSGDLLEIVTEEKMETFEVGVQAGGPAGRTPLGPHDRHMVLVPQRRSPRAGRGRPKDQEDNFQLNDDEGLEVPVESVAIPVTISRAAPKAKAGQSAEGAERTHSERTRSFSAEETDVKKQVSSASVEDFKKQVSSASVEDFKKQVSSASVQDPVVPEGPVVSELQEAVPTQQREERQPDSRHGKRVKKFRAELLHQGPKCSNCDNVLLPDAQFCRICGIPVKGNGITLTVDEAMQNILNISDEAAEKARKHADRLLETKSKAEQLLAMLGSKAEDGPEKAELDMQVMAEIAQLARLNLEADHLDASDDQEELQDRTVKARAAMHLVMRKYADNEADEDGSESWRTDILTHIKATRRLTDLSKPVLMQEERTMRKTLEVEYNERVRRSVASERQRLRRIFPRASSLEPPKKAPFKKPLARSLEAEMALVDERLVEVRTEALAKLDSARLMTYLREIDPLKEILNWQDMDQGEGDARLMDLKDLICSQEINKYMEVVGTLSKRFLGHKTEYRRLADRLKSALFESDRLRSEVGLWREAFLKKNQESAVLWKCHAKWLSRCVSEMSRRQIMVSVPQALLTDTFDHQTAEKAFSEELSIAGKKKDKLASRIVRNQNAVIPLVNVEFSKLRSEYKLKSFAMAESLLPFHHFAHTLQDFLGIDQLSSAMLTKEDVDSTIKGFEDFGKVYLSNNEDEEDGESRWSKAIGVASMLAQRLRAVFKKNTAEAAKEKIGMAQQIITRVGNRELGTLDNYKGIIEEDNEAMKGVAIGGSQLLHKRLTDAGEACDAFDLVDREQALEEEVEPGAEDSDEEGLFGHVVGAEKEDNSQKIFTKIIVPISVPDMCEENPDELQNRVSTNMKAMLAAAKLKNKRLHHQAEKEAAAEREREAAEAEHGRQLRGMFVRAAGQTTALATVSKFGRKSQKTKTQDGLDECEDEEWYNYGFDDAGGKRSSTREAWFDAARASQPERTDSQVTGEDSHPSTPGGTVKPSVVRMLDDAGEGELLQAAGELPPGDSGRLWASPSLKHMECFYPWKPLPPMDLPQVPPEIAGVSGKPDPASCERREIDIKQMTEEEDQEMDALTKRLCKAFQQKDHDEVTEVLSQMQELMDAFNHRRSKLRKSIRKIKMASILKQGFGSLAAQVAAMAQVQDELGADTSESDDGEESSEEEDEFEDDEEVAPSSGPKGKRRKELPAAFQENDEEEEDEQTEQGGDNDGKQRRTNKRRITNDSKDSTRSRKYVGWDDTVAEEGDESEGDEDDAEEADLDAQQGKKRSAQTKAQRKDRSKKGKSEKKENEADVSEDEDEATSPTRKLSPSKEKRDAKKKKKKARGSKPSASEVMKELGLGRPGDLEQTVPSQSRSAFEGRLLVDGDGEPAVGRQRLPSSSPSSGDADSPTSTDGLTTVDLRSISERMAGRMLSLTGHTGAGLIRARKGKKQPVMETVETQTDKPPPRGVEQATNTELSMKQKVACTQTEAQAVERLEYTRRLRSKSPQRSFAAKLRALVDGEEAVQSEPLSPESQQDSLRLDKSEVERTLETLESNAKNVANSKSGDTEEYTQEDMQQVLDYAKERIQRLADKEHAKGPQPTDTDVAPSTSGTRFSSPQAVGVQGPTSRNWKKKVKTFANLLRKVSRGLPAAVQSALMDDVQAEDGTPSAGTNLSAGEQACAECDNILAPDENFCKKCGTHRAPQATSEQAAEGGEAHTRTRRLAAASPDAGEEVVEVVDTIQQSQIVWEDIPREVLNWLKLNLMQRQQAELYCTSWDASDMSYWPEMALGARERLVQEFEEFLDEVLQCMKPTKHGVRQGLRQKYRTYRSESPPADRRTRSASPAGRTNRGAIEGYEYPLIVGDSWDELTGKLRDASRIAANQAEWLQQKRQGGQQHKTVDAALGINFPPVGIFDSEATDQDPYCLGVAQSLGFEMPPGAPMMGVSGRRWGRQQRGQPKMGEPLPEPPPAEPLSAPEQGAEIMARVLEWALRRSKRRWKRIATDQLRNNAQAFIRPEQQRGRAATLELGVGAAASKTAGALIPSSPAEKSPGKRRPAARGRPVDPAASTVPPAGDRTSLTATAGSWNVPTPPGPPSIRQAVTPARPRVEEILRKADKLQQQAAKAAQAPAEQYVGCVAWKYNTPQASSEQGAAAAASARQAPPPFESKVPGGLGATLVLEREKAERTAAWANYIRSQNPDMLAEAAAQNKAAMDVLKEGQRAFAEELGGAVSSPRTPTASSPGVGTLATPRSSPRGPGSGVPRFPPIAAAGAPQGNSARLGSSGSGFKPAKRE